MKNKHPLIVNGYDFGNNKVYGIHRNAMETMRAMDDLLCKTDSDFEVEVVVPEMTSSTPQYKKIKVSCLSLPHVSQLDKIKWRSRFFPSYVEEHGGLGLDMTLAFPHSGKYCVFDYDCIPENMPNSCYGAFATVRVRHYKNRVSKSLNNAVLVFTDSKYSKDQIEKIYGVNPCKIVVIPCAWQHMLRVKQDDGILERLGLEDGRYFFSLGSRYPYKNFHWVACAARNNPQYRFVVTGSNVNEGCTCKDNELANLTFTGYLSDGEVKALEAHCRAFLHPSLAEGFGIPPLEAMSVGAHCVVSNAASLPEVYGESVWYIDPTDYEHIDLDEILSRPLKGSIEDVLSRYSWENSARLLLDALAQVGDLL